VSNDAEIPVLYLFLMHLLGLSATVNRQIEKMQLLLQVVLIFSYRIFWCNARFNFSSENFV